MGATPIDPRPRGSAPTTGERLAGRYVLEALLGRGGMGVVFRARDLQLRRDVAIKFVLGGGGATRLARFARECELVSQAGGRGVVQVHECGERDGQPYLVMELLRGESLEDLLARGPLEPVEAARLLEAVARTLGHVHARGILHRDLKPGNILIAEDGLPRLADFGLAWHADSDSLTRTGELMGTPMYMAPELFQGGRPDVASDLFALGVMTYQAVTGRLPFDATSLPLLLAAMADDDAPPPSTLRPIPRGWDAVCAHALAATPAARYSRAEDLACDLARLARGEEPAAPRGRPRLRRRTLVRLAAVALVAVALAGGVVARAQGTARTRAALDEVHDWDADQLVAFDLGLGSVALERLDLERRIADLEACDGWWLASGERARVAQALDRLHAHRRLVDHGAALHGDCDPRPGGPTTLAVNGLLLQAHGRTDEALASVAAAFAAAPDSTVARRARTAVWRAHLEATPVGRAGEVVAKLDRLGAPDERASAVAALEGAAGRWYAEAIDAGDRASLEPLAALAARLAPDLQAALARGKVAATDARASAWSTTHGDAASRAALTRLGELLRAPPSVRMGPEVSAQLEREVGAAVDAWRTSLTAEATRRAIELESVAWYELGYAHPGGLPPDLVLAAIALANSEQVVSQALPSPALVLIGLRTGGLVEGPGAIPRRSDVILRKLIAVRDELARVAELQPTQSARFALAVVDRQRQASQPVAQRIAALERVLAADAARDLHPERLGELHELLGMDRLEARDVEGALACGHEAFALARDPDRIDSAVRLLGDARAAEVARGPAPSRARAIEAELAALEEGAAELERRLAVERDDRMRSRAVSVIARLSNARISLRLERGDPPEQVAPLARRAFALWDAHPTFVFARENDDEAVERITGVLERTGDPDDAARARRLRERRGQR